MRRLSCAFLGVLAVVLPIPAIAAQITVTPSNIGPGYVNAWVNVVGPLAGSCPIGFLCFTNDATITITPCPVGVTCSGGSYTFTFTPGEPVPVTLVAGINYSFTGTWLQKFGYAAGSPCSYTCTLGGALPPLNLTAPGDDARPYWDVIPVSATPEAIVVSATLKNHVTANCGAWSCRRYDTLLEVSPCVVDIEGQGSRCNGAGTTVYYASYWNNSSPTFLVTLSPGIEYTFAGNVFVEGMGASCVPSGGCTARAYMVPKTFSPEVATRNSTWGRVKALYREP